MTASSNLQPTYHDDYAVSDQCFSAAMLQCFSAVAKLGTLACLAAHCSTALIQVEGATSCSGLFTENARHNRRYTKQVVFVTWSHYAVLEHFTACCESSQVMIACPSAAALNHMLSKKQHNGELHTSLSHHSVQPSDPAPNTTAAARSALLLLLFQLLLFVQLPVMLVHRMLIR
jgi:hypothetical protein